MTREVAGQERLAQLKGYIRAQVKARRSKHDTHEEMEDADRAGFNFFGGRGRSMSLSEWSNGGLNSAHFRGAVGASVVEQIIVIVLGRNYGKKELNKARKQKGNSYKTDRFLRRRRGSGRPLRDRDLKEGQF